MARVLRVEVWWVDFEPAIGGEIRKTRPAIIVSGNAANVAISRQQVVPLLAIMNSARRLPLGYGHE